LFEGNPIYCLLSLGAVALVYFLPQTPVVIGSIYKSFIGDSFQQLYQFHKKDIEVAYHFGLRILGLFAGWFILLFIVEIALAIVSVILSFLYTNLKFLFVGSKVNRK